MAAALEVAEAVSFAAAAGVEESGTDGAGPSCHSHDVHVNCPQPSKR
jgi:hypothetical protein